MEIQRVTVKLHYTVEGHPMHLRDHAKMIRNLVADNLAVKDVKCEPISLAQWEQPRGE